jgi:uncharacterized protein
MSVPSSELRLGAATKSCCTRTQCAVRMLGVSGPPHIRELTVQSADLSLAGSFWAPAEPRDVSVLMHPGSGPSDRHNDVFFPPIRRHLLESGIAVSSFDKRGVGGSEGRWQEAAIVPQASDATACVEALRADAAFKGPIGLYGHSQGGWVVVEAAARCEDVAFVVTSSGPGVTPGEQERWAMRNHLIRAGISAAEIEEVEGYYDRVLAMMRSGMELAGARASLEPDGFPQAFETVGLPVLPDDEAEWQHMAALIDYDPRPALGRIEVPMLALFGAEDRITPVDESVAVFQETVRPGLLQVKVFAGADHRLQAGDPPALVEGYLATMADFVLEAIVPKPVSR